MPGSFRDNYWWLKSSTSGSTRSRKKGSGHHKRGHKKAHFTFKTEHLTRRNAPKGPLG